MRYIPALYIPEPVWFVQKWLDTSPTLATLGPSNYTRGVTVNQHPRVHHPLDACNYLVVDEPQLS
jgi:hypothetical protein